MTTAELELARVEGARTLRNPAVWCALVPSAMWVIANVTGDDGHEDRLIILLGFPLLIPGFVIVVHGILAMLRSRYSNTDELLDVAPVGADRRSVAHGASAVAGFVLALGATAVVYAAVRPGPTIGPGTDYFRGVVIPRPNIAQLLQAPFAFVAVFAFALALVRWIPTWLVIVPLAFLAMIQGVFLGAWFGVPTGAVTWWWPMATGVVHGEWIGCGEFDTVCDVPVTGFDRVTPWWHLVYLAAVAVFFVVVAVLRHRRDRSAWLTSMVALAIVLGSGIGQMVVWSEFVSGGAP